MKVRTGARTDIGRSRGRNEDAYLVRDPLFAVADGMGGHRGGNVASRIALEAMRPFDAPGPHGAGVLVQDIRNANARVLERGEADRDLRGMGTTITAVLVEGDGATVAHVGDSRAYLFRDGTLEQLTQDHTLVHQLVVEGRLSPEQAGRHPQRSILTRAVGVEESVEVDQTTVELQAGDRLLLCTDGLTGMLPDRAIAEILSAEDDPQRASDRLIEAANGAGGEDNITVVLVDISEGTDPPEITKAEPAPSPEARDAPAGRPPVRPARRSRRRVAAGVASALVLVFILAWIGLHSYVNRQWYVGASNGRVAIYHGIPTRVVGLKLSHVASATNVPAADAERLEPWAGVADGITATSLQDAQAIVTQIQRDLEASNAGSGG